MNSQVTPPGSGKALPEPHPQNSLLLRAAAIAIVGVLATLMVLGGLQLFAESWRAGLGHIETVLVSGTFWSSVGVGLLAQAIDGALGMAYGITSTSFLLASGVPPAVASASVHMAEVFTTGTSGLAHARLGNVQRALFLRLLLPGSLGALAGAWLITQVDASIMKPLITVYLLVMGGFVLRRAWRGRRARSGPLRHVGKLALAGGFIDSSGGGGWGPVVTTTLVGRGEDPRTTIGTVNFAEFFLTLVSAGALFAWVDGTVWPVVAGLVVGGMIAAPFAALACRQFKPRALMFAVGALIVGLSIYNLSRLV